MIYLYKIPNAFSFKTYLHFNNRIPLMKFIPRRSPIQIEARQGLQQYIHSKKVAPPWNGVRLHLTFLRLATLVGIGHEGTSSAQQTNYPTHHPSSATHPNRNQMPSGICSAKKRFVGRGGWGPGEGPRALRFALGPSPGLKTVWKWNFKRNGKQRAIQSATLSKNNKQSNLCEEQKEIQSPAHFSIKE